MPGLSVCGAIRDGQWRGASGAALTPERNAAIADWRTHERRLVVNALKTPVNPINASHYRYHNMSHHARFSVGGAPQAQRENARWLLMARRRVVGSDRFARRAQKMLIRSGRVPKRHAHMCSETRYASRAIFSSGGGAANR
jgi:hypothetical protein